MKSLEQIYIRITENNRSEIIRMLFTDLEHNRETNSPKEIRIYIHANIETDFCVFMYWESELPRHGSRIARQIVTGLEAVGIVKHTIWKGLNGVKKDFSLQ